MVQEGSEPRMSNKPKNYRNPEKKPVYAEKKSNGKSLALKIFIVGLCVVMAIMFSIPALLFN